MPEDKNKKNKPKIDYFKVKNIEPVEEQNRDKNILDFLVLDDLRNAKREYNNGNYGSAALSGVMGVAGFVPYGGAAKALGAGVKTIKALQALELAQNAFDVGRYVNYKVNPKQVFEDYERKIIE